MRDYWVSGDANALCDRCGSQYKLSELKKTWDGYLVCPRDWEPRNELDFIRIRPERSNIKVSKPEAADQFVVVSYIIADGAAFCSTNCAVAGVAQAGCAVAGKNMTGLI